MMFSKGAFGYKAQSWGESSGEDGDGAFPDTGHRWLLKLWAWAPLPVRREISSESLRSVGQKTCELT